MAFVNRGSLSATVTVSVSPDLSGNFVCSGAADQVEINAAIAYVGAIGGGEVKLLQGTFTLTAEVTIDVDYIMLIGCGHGTVLSQGVADEAIRVGQDRVHVIIEHLRINGNDIAIAGINLDGASDHIIYYNIVAYCYIHNCDIGIRGNHIQRSDIISNQIVDCDTDAIYFDDFSRLNFLGNFIFTTNPGSAIHLATGVMCRIVDNHCVYNQQYGIELIDVNDAVIVANHCSWNILDGINTTATGRNLITGNICFTNTQRGIYLETANDTVVSGNLLDNNGNDGIEVASAEVLMTGNMLYSNGAFGINITGNDCKCLCNFYDGNTSGPISDTGLRNGFHEVQATIWDNQHAQVNKSNIGDHMTLLMAADQDVTVRFDFRVPSDFQGLVRARIVVVPTAANPTLRWGVDTDWGLCDEAYNAGSDAIALANEDLTQNDLECLNIDTALDGITAGDHVGVLFTRNGANVDDDAGDTHIIIFYMQYV